MTLTELIAALEKATEGSRELDAEIGALTHKGPNADEVGEAFEGFVEVSRHGRRIRKYRPAYFTSSIDAALTLVPEGYAYRLEGWLAFTARVGIPEHNSHSAHTKTNMAIALCIAALKSRT